ncbi:PE-PPE domain-containing protein [Mycobacterium sp. P7213]|uniref:PE-PPE domain-containing protein n=1 Tax=Mycobacterium sp. P7213 TaxID=2478465 RepID=UPI001F14ED04|nr:PE-PPE domain-containing protein [Mycobacterium sp. P7213]
MTHSSYRWLTAGVLAGGCAGLMGLTSMFNASFAFGESNGTALIMGYVLTPDPGAVYQQRVMDLFINPANPFPGQSIYSGYTPVVEPLNPSDYQQSLLDAAKTLNQDIARHLEDGPVTVFGVSSTTSIATQAMIDLAQAGASAPDPANLHFVLVEDLNTPNGGIFTRFPLDFGSLPPTPVDTPYTIDIYNFEYSGATDFPKYPLNLLALANSMAGYVYLHPYLITGYPSSWDPSAMADAVKLPMSEGYDGDTSIYLIPTMNLPLLESLRMFPLFGPAMADFIQPALRVLIDLGYDRSDPADIATPVSWGMPGIDWDLVSQNIQLGVEQGWTAAQVDLGLLPQSALPDLYPYLPDLSGLIGA